MAKKLNRKKNINKKMVRFLRMCRKTKKCNLRISERCNECEFLETCQNNRQERQHIVSEEKKARKMNLSCSKKERSAKADDFYDNEVALNDSYDDNDFESYDETDDAVESCESCDDNDNNEAKCHPYEFACPYIEECDGNCVYDGG